MAGKKHPERLGPWYPSDIDEDDMQKLLPIAAAIESSGYTLDWYGGRRLDGSRVFEALILTVDEKTQLEDESGLTRARRAKRNRANGLPEETGAPDPRRSRLRWTVFHEQPGVKRAPKLIDAIMDAVEVKQIELSTDDTPETLAAQAD